jgi:hypothetical protein
VSGMTPKNVAVHNQQVAAGLLPPDSPPDFVIPEGLSEQGLPWWFPPHFRSDVMPSGSLGGDQVTPNGTPVDLAWDYFAHEQAPLVTRESLQEKFSYRISEMSKPLPIPPPIRVWSDPQMERIRFGYEAQEMEEKWHAFMEGDQLLLLRSWTGILVLQASFVQCKDGWRINSAVVESDLDLCWLGGGDVASVELESVIFFMVLGKSDQELDNRRLKEWAKWESGPRIVITKRKGIPIPIVKPGVSIKHGKVADQHPLQREAYDQYVARGYDTAVKVLHKGKTPEDVYFSAARHEVRAFQSTGIESSRHAGLAKGAKQAAWEWSQGKTPATSAKDSLEFDFG